MGIIKHSQGSQNSKFAMYLQYLKKDKASKFPTSWFQPFSHQSLSQGDTIIINGHDQPFSK